MRFMRALEAVSARFAPRPTAGDSEQQAVSLATSTADLGLGTVTTSPAPRSPEQGRIAEIAVLST